MFRLLSELERREAEAANKPKPAPRHIIELPHNYRHPVDPQRLVLQKELSELHPDINIDDEKPAKLIKELAPKLGKLARDIKTWLDRKR